MVGNVWRNLTSWEDADATRLAFIAGNTAFAAFFFGRAAVLLLWLAFIAAFLLPLREHVDALQGLPQVGSIVDAAAKALVAIRSSILFAVEALRERFARPMS